MRAIRIATAIAALLLIPAAAAHASGGLISGWGDNAYGSGMKLKHPKPGRCSLEVEALDILGHEAKPAVRKFRVS